MEMTFVDRVETWQTGGGVMVDIIHLKDGRILGINDELVVLYQDEDAFYESNGDEPKIDLLAGWK